VKKAVKIFSCIQSIDSVEIAEEINRRCKEENKKIDVFIEVNIGNEETKSGFFPNAEVIKESLMKIKDMEFINLKGMMVIEPFSENPENSRQYFINARELFDELKKEFAGLEALSMGMSNSYRIAIEEGSNMVRLGTAIFGKR
jgi:pyridoxal phosphate enzyme (YggS family)